MSQEETPNSISFTPLKLLKVDVRQDYNGTGVTMEFIDNNGTRFKTPSIPYPENFDPMKIEHAECRGDEIRIKNENGDLLISIHADNIEYNSPIGISADSRGQLELAPEEDENATQLQQGLDWGSAMTQAFGRTNQARQRVDEAIQETLNAREPRHPARPTIGASAWFRAQAREAGIEGNPNGARWEYEGQEEIPKIKIDFDMKCTCCEGKIHYPDKLIQLLGEGGTIKYFEFCKKTSTDPQMFCCSCFGLMKNNSNIISAVNKMNLKIKDMMDLSEREEEVTKREKELDEQIKAIKK